MDVRALLDDPTRLELVAQPIVDVRRGIVTGYEVLSRFRLEPRVGPDRVFAEAARQGLGGALEALVVRRALALADVRPADCFLSLNVDPLHLAVPEVWAAFDARASLSGVVVELTEHRAVEDMRGLLERLGELRQRGALIAVDDAGSGYSGLQQILELRPQILKLDRALVSNVHEDDAKRALVEMLGAFAGRLDCWLLAEGIEVAAELELLRQLGVPLAQGYFLGRPAAPWAQLSPASSELLSQAPPSLRSARTVRRLLEPCATCGGADPWPEANLAVRVAEDGRPLGMRFVFAGETRVRDEHDLMRVKPESSLEPVAQRAATRSERLRWDPVVCVDDRGRFRGIVRLARLVCALASDESQQTPALPIDVN